ncbi:MAG: hypothetical protein WAT19_03070 [Ferruginibacter sp.]
MADIHLHDSFFVFSYSLIFLGMAGILLAGWGLYLLADKYLFSKKWVWAHIIISIFSLLVLLIMLLANNNRMTYPLYGFDYSSWNHQNILGPYLKTAGFSFIILIVCQFIPVINFVVGFYKYRHFKN